MKKQIRLTESELTQLIQESANEYMRRNQKVNESVDERFLGMLGGLAANKLGLSKFVANFIARALNLDTNGVLYRVLRSKLFAVALGNEIQNSRKLHNTPGEGVRKINGADGGILGSNGDGKYDWSDILNLLGIKSNVGVGSGTGASAGPSAGGTI